MDGIVLAVGIWVMSALFGTTSAEGGQVSASLSGVAAVGAFVLAFAYYIVLEGYLGQTLGK
ncbi:MAG: hypothetical protein LC808_28915, partial [Actinobacteria bacterium]|nr:hypothetical protein [Actinomycetota bacterium]